MTKQHIYSVHWDEPGRINNQTRVLASSTRNAVTKVKRMRGGKGTGFVASRYYRKPRTTSQLFGKRRKNPYIWG